jgi:hypothetical protein
MTQYSNFLALLAMLAMVFGIVGFVLIFVGKWGGLLPIACGIAIAFLWRRLTIQARASNLANTQRIAGAQEDLRIAVLLKEAEENLDNAKRNLENSKRRGLNRGTAKAIQKGIDAQERVVDNLRAQVPTTIRFRTYRGPQ